MRNMEHKLETHDLAGSAKLLVVNMKSAASNYFGSFVRAGFRFADRKKYEVPHLLEHLAFEGNRQYPDAVKFKFAIETSGTATNAATSDQLVWYFFNSVPEHLLAVVEIAANQLLFPSFNPVRVGDEKGIIEKEITRRLKNDSMRLQLYHGLALRPKASMPYDERIKLLSGIERPDVADFHTKTHVPANATFVLAGQFKAAEITAVIKLLNHYLSSVDEGTQQVFSSLYNKNSKRRIDTHDSFVDSEHHFQLSFIQEGLNDESQPALSMLGSLLTSGLGGRIMLRARDAGLTYGTASGAWNNTDLNGLTLADRTQPAVLAELFELCVRELRDVVGGNFSDEEFARARGLREGNLLRGNQTPGALGGWYANDFAMGYKIESPQDYLKRLMAVTKEDIVRVGSEYVNKDNWTLTLVGTGLDKETDRYQKILDRYFK